MIDTKLQEYFICGGFGGICAVLVGHPLDTIKVRMQTMPVPKPGDTGVKIGPWKFVQSSIEKEGIKCLFKGITFPLTIVAPIFAVSFWTYGVGKQMFGVSNPSNTSSTQIFEAGAFSGFCSALLTAPGERVKCLLQTQGYLNNSKIYGGPIDCIRTIYKLGGVSNLFKGIGATILREVPGSGIYFVTYESLKESVKKSQLSNTLGTILAGGSAGISYWIVGMPADVLKSRLQTVAENNKSIKMTTVCRQLIKNEGICALYKGMSPVLLRGFVANAACFVGFDFCKGWLNTWFPKFAQLPEEKIEPIAQKTEEKLKNNTKRDKKS